MLFTVVLGALSLPVLGSSIPSAPPARRVTYPVGTVVPGPGLPSIESLGLTNEDLYDPEFLQKHGLVSGPPNTTDVAKRQAIKYCTTGPPSSVANVNACQNYLASLGTTNCVAPRSGVLMCLGIGNGGAQFSAQIWGTAKCHDSDASWCQDVAPVLGEIIAECNFFWQNGPEWVAMGGDAARGNGCLQIDIHG